MNGRAGIMHSMLLPARPTLRCLTSDLDALLQGQARTDAGNVGTKVGFPASAVNHPIVQKAQAAFPLKGESEVLRESISEAKGHPWWKLKIGEWRGAAHQDEKTGQVWVCAAGLRRDFYDEFGSTIRRLGHDHFLPSQEDLALLKRERATAIFKIWESELHSAALVALDVAIEEQGDAELDIRHPTTEQILSECRVSVFRIPDDPTGIVEVTVTFGRNRWQDTRLIERAEEVVLAALDPQEQDWRPGSLKDGTQSIFSQLVTEEPFDSFVARAKFRRAPGTTMAGSHSHYTDDPELMRKTVVGEAVEAICGAWFVPRQDHVKLETCQVCDTGYQATRA